MSIGSPSISSSPEVGASIRVTMRASVDLPQPDSPTMARVLPFSTLEADTPFDGMDDLAAAPSSPPPTW
ncbi:MAG: hypothetical protein V9G20_30030 [Candidatus Promineifilaceae bacterium]